MEKKVKEKDNKEKEKKEMIEKQRLLSQRWAMQKWIINFLTEHEEVREKERNEKEKENLKEIENWNGIIRFQKIEILRKKQDSLRSLRIVFDHLR